MEVAACPHTFFPAELMKKGYNFLGITTILVPYIRDFVTFKFFFLIFAFKTFASSYQKIYHEMRRVEICK